jgi:cytochrome c553
MNRRYDASWIAALLVAVGVGPALPVLHASTAQAQLRDPPLGWDIWDPEWTRRDVWEPNRMDRSLRWRMTRHRAFMQDGVPPEFRGARNPMTQTPATVREGRALYMENCASCHDASGTERCRPCAVPVAGPVGSPDPDARRG